MIRYQSTHVHRLAAMSILDLALCRAQRRLITPPFPSDSPRISRSLMLQTVSKIVRAYPDLPRTGECGTRCRVFELCGWPEGLNKG